MKWAHHIAKAETSLAGVLLKAKEELQHSIGFNELLEKLVITAH